MTYNHSSEGNTWCMNQNRKEYYEQIMKMNYDELVAHLLKKYGPAKYDFFKGEKCSSKNQKVTRSEEGLFCHHIDEDKAILLANPEHALKNPYEYQKANRLVYCNFLEHLLLHILIVEKEKDEKVNDNELQGIGGAVNYIVKQLNDFYSGYEYKQKWMIIATSIIKDDYDSYIMMLKRLWKDIQLDIVLSLWIKKEDLAKGWMNNIYTNILKELDINYSSFSDFWKN